MLILTNNINENQVYNFYTSSITYNNSLFFYKVYCSKIDRARPNGI